MKGSKSSEKAVRLPRFLAFISFSFARKNDRFHRHLDQTYIQTCTPRAQDWGFCCLVVDLSRKAHYDRSCLGLWYDGLWPCQVCEISCYWSKSASASKLLLEKPRLSVSYSVVTGIARLISSHANSANIWHALYIKHWNSVKQNVRPWET